MYQITVFQYTSLDNVFMKIIDLHYILYIALLHNDHNDWTQLMINIYFKK